MKALQKILIVLAVCLLASCKNSSHDSGAGSGASGVESGYEGPDNLEHSGSESDTTKIGGRTPAGSTTEQVPSGSERASGHLQGDSLAK